MLEKIKSFRFVVFLLTILFDTAYIILCKVDGDLIQLSGLVIAINGMATALIGGKTITDIKGKAE